MNITAKQVLAGQPVLEEVKQYFYEYFYQSELVGPSDFAALIHGHMEKPSQVYAWFLVGVVAGLNNIPYPDYPRTPLYCDADEAWEVCWDIFVNAHLGPESEPEPAA
jgi:hypothetical protein